jgi:hypothetical protein
MNPKGWGAMYIPLTTREILEKCVTSNPYDAFYGCEKIERKRCFGRGLGAGVSRAVWDAYWAPFKGALDVLYIATDGGVSRISTLTAQQVATAIDILFP